MASAPDKRRVSYYFDPDVGSYTYGLGHPMKPHRILIAHHLISAYNMLEKMHVLRAKRASAESMTRFHTDEYVQFLHRVTPETADELTYHGSRFCVGDDNPPFEGVFEFCSISAGGSLAAAHRLASGATDIAINWAGGLHHAKKQEASGFCYINDIVLGILELLRTYPRVLYIDIDCHHGDGVEEAFYTTDRVMTCSFHKHGEYFPGTGDSADRGEGRGRGYAVNVPLKDGISDETYKSIFEPVITKILEVFRPSAIVLQCGSDSLAGDKLGCFNLTMRGHAACVQFVRRQNIPMMLLGGGGYTVKNVARTWCYETACALGIEASIDEMLPYNAYFEWFGPKYRLEVPDNNMENINLKDGYLTATRDKVLAQLSELQPAPSSQMQDVPRESVGAHLGWRIQGEEAQDELDKSLARHSRFVYKMQEPDPSDEETYDSDASASTSARNARKSHRASRPQTRNKKRMSIITNQPLDLPQWREFELCSGAAEMDRKTRRRFFTSGDENSPGVDEIVEVYNGVVKGSGGLNGASRLGETMSRGGVSMEVDEEDMSE
ncbi:hypothetical protein GLOTRDRAFT_113736 [Gloeophyllum trabeum ATCC 11539]|uniref:Histone deacetylase n=1 Tax=Gloeophyllum trabeum (strain ATCC 11539 / FP-39264 / Madison 617) TaxID=670483 RepID=S7RZG3_GLOTA|nr:uncharacterized protein GLOTRDRAFT_113736 [Gloeophyllum trabeum ATCC 11539]EPQ58839.1 hypothetical protein GLOTRDRAFT_113736 [Gloeophyllum trabeum ATCC 11539]